MPIKDFERLLSEAVDEALSSLGETRKQALYYRLEESYSIKKNEIPFKIEAFERAIEESLGAKAHSVETLIVNLLNGKIGKILRKDETEEFTFAERVKHARECLYKEFIDNIQSGLAVFYFENLADLDSSKLVAANHAAEKITGIATEEALGKTITEIYSEISKTDIARVLADVLHSMRARDLGQFRRCDEHGGESSFSVTAFPFSNGYIGLAFKNSVPRRSIAEPQRKDDEPTSDLGAGQGQWRWEVDTSGRHVFSGRTRAIERWVQREVTSESHSKYFSARGKECLQIRDTARAREFFSKAEEAYLGLGKIDEAFENASWCLKTYFFEESLLFKEFFEAVNVYVQKYKDYSLDSRFIENLAHFSQWKGYQQCEEQKLHEARSSYADAEEMFLTLKQRERALFNASQRVLTYTKENKAEEYIESANQFLDKYRELAGNKHYKEVLAHYFSYKADECRDHFKAEELRREAERMFLDLGQRHLAFENACRLVDLYCDSVTFEGESWSKRCFEATERFFEEYQDFSENEYYKKRLSKYYLLQARTLASQLKRVLY